MLAAEPLCICGIDVAAPPQARATKIQNAEDLFRAFEKQFTAKEVDSRLGLHCTFSSTCTQWYFKLYCGLQWRSIKAAGDGARQMQAFQKHWSLKEV